MKFLSKYWWLILLSAVLTFWWGPDVLAQQVALDLIPPTEIQGYAEGIQVGGGNLTSLVVLITNYVLGFLGLCAITAIIYAGILYVANFGNDELTGKAKSIIFYVALGIIVIILSYAIVNTIVGVVSPTGQGGVGGGSPGRIGVSDRPVTTLDSLFEVDDKDYVVPILNSLRNLGDICPNTPIGLSVNNSGCAQNQLIPDTDSDGIVNVLDTDDDDDGVVDELDDDDDGDGVNDDQDKCPDTLSFVTFKVSDLERNKLQVDRVDRDEYESFIEDNEGCAEYQRESDIDGDGVLDQDDCDADNDGIIDNQSCYQLYDSTFPEGEEFDEKFIKNNDPLNGIRVFNVIRDDKETINELNVRVNAIDDDDDNDGVVDFGNDLQPTAQQLLLRQLSNNFTALESFVRITCATLPQTNRVFDYCGYGPNGEPIGQLVRLLDDLSSDLNFTDFEEFNTEYQEFLSIAQTFPQVRARINASQFEGFLPPDSSSLRISFDATETIDPNQEFCPIGDNNYYWFVNKTLDFSQGLSGILNSSANPPDATGVFFDYDFTEAGIFNVQLLVRSACKYNTVNPGANENNDVDAAIAGVASARISVFPPRAQLIVSVDGQDDPGSRPVRILTGTQSAIPFDLTQSTTSRGGFQFLNYDCGNGVSNTIQGNESNWQFECSYPDATGSKVVRLQARDAEGDVNRVVSLQFSNVIAALQVSPGLRGTTTDLFTFDGTRSQASQQISNYTYVVSQQQGTTFTEIDRFQDQTVSYTFPAPGVYEVSLEVSTGGASNQLSSDTVTITIDEQDPIAAFEVSFPESIRPARALLDGSLSFHPDFPDQSSALSYIWEVDGVTLQQRTAGVSGPFTYEQVTSGSDARVYFDFQTIGVHDIRLTVVRGEGRDTVFEDIEVETLLGVDFEVDKPAAKINEVITFTPESDRALGYFWDFGDGDTLVGDDEPVVHIYEQQGEYPVSLTVEDAAGNTNQLERTVRVGLQNEPVPFVQVFVNNIEQDLRQSDCIEVSRRDNVVFDAGSSVNIEGQTSGLSYLWEIEDFEEIVRTRTFTRIFRDLTRGGCIDVDLTITDLSTQSVAVAETISIEVVNVDPEITDIRYAVTEPELVTPVTVSVSAVGVRDIDGRPTRYRWWYFEEGQGGRELDSRITDIPRTTFVIPPNNVEGTNTTYYFAVEIEDSDGGRTNSLIAVGPSEPLVITNGPNVAPVAEFVTDRSTVAVNELITFTSTTVDPLGEFIPSAGYQWDFEGDGEYERGISGSRVTHRYPAPGLYTPTLRVTKNGLSSQYEMNVRVLPNTKDPQAAFIFAMSGAEVKFISNSTVDPQLEDKSLQLAWDFDTTIDTDGNGITDDDADSAELAPTFEFEGDRNVLVGLTVTDSVGNKDTVVRRLPFLVEDTTRGPLGATVQVPLRAELRTNPPRNELDRKIYLQPPFGDVVFISNSSTGKIQEYRVDTNLFADSDGDGIPDNDIDNKTHPSWKDGSAFVRTYRQSEGRIRARLTLVDLNGLEKSQVVDVIFSEEPPIQDLNTLEDPDEILQLLETVPVIQFDVDNAFAQPGEELNFDASQTRFPNEEVQEYRWDFDGDGLVDEISFEPQFTYAYQEEGAFQVILEAVSEDGLLGEYTQTVFIRGGLELPVADFSFQVDANEVQFTNLSTVDATLNQEEVQYEWSFQKVDLSTANEWESYLTLDELVLAEREFDLAPVWVQGDLMMEQAEIGTGIIPRHVTLGSDGLLARFPAGTAVADQERTPYVGTLRLAEADSSQVEIEEETVVALYETGSETILELSEALPLVFDGVILNAKLYQQEEGELTEIGEGIVDDNLTLFELDTFGGNYVITGSLESSGSTGEVSLGVSTVAEPVKVFPEAGLYRVNLQVTDSVGEQSETSELITIDQNLMVVEPSGVDPEEVPNQVEQPSSGGQQPVEVEEPVIPEPNVNNSDGGGLSYFWLAFVIFLLIVVGAVVFIVVRTIRQRHEELEASETISAAPRPQDQVIEPEVVQEQPVPQQQAQPETSAAPTPQSAAQVPPAATPETQSDAGASEKKKDDEPPSGPSSKGPIPDWLKN